VSPKALDDLRRRGLNFDPAERREFTPEKGWHLDDIRRPLPPDPPGPPGPGGTWEVAQRLMRDYSFADPSIVRATYDPDEELEGRTMLLELRFLGLRFHVGVRVEDVYDERCEEERGTMQVWGWNYRTLEGHLEMGQMDWQLRKVLETGEVEFRIKAYSRPSPERSLLVRAGFRLFGRRHQLRFLRRTSERMAQLTAAALETTCK
jgi:uncharacterized protein (UPF0548 family)